MGVVRGVGRLHRPKVQNDYHHQFMRNMRAQQRERDISDVGQMAGVSATDWSWSALIADLDLDGRKDIFVTNGLATRCDFQDYIASSRTGNNEGGREWWSRGRPQAHQRDEQHTDRRLSLRNRGT